MDDSGKYTSVISMNGVIGRSAESARKKSPLQKLLDADWLFCNIFGKYLLHKSPKNVAIFYYFCDRRQIFIIDNKLFKINTTAHKGSLSCWFS